MNPAPTNDRNCPFCEDMAPDYHARVQAWHARHIEHPIEYGLACATFARWQTNPARLVDGHWVRERRATA